MVSKNNLTFTGVKGLFFFSAFMLHFGNSNFFFLYSTMSFKYNLTSKSNKKKILVCIQDVHNFKKENSVFFFF